MLGSVFKDYDYFNGHLDASENWKITFFQFIMYETVNRKYNVIDFNLVFMLLLEFRFLKNSDSNPQSECKKGKT